MKTRTPSGVTFRIGAHPHGLRRWHVSVIRTQGASKPTVHSEIVHGGLLTTIYRMRAIASRISAEAPAAVRDDVAVPRPRTIEREPVSA